MVRRLDMDKTQGIDQLFASGMSRRQIARTLGINRKSVDRHLANSQPKGASVQEAPTGQAPTGSEISKGAKALTGSEEPISEPLAPKEKSTAAAHSRSQCARYRDQIIAKIEQGLTAQRIYQDLVADYGFASKPHQPKHPKAKQPIPNHRDTILHHLEVLKMKLKAEQLDSFLQDHAGGTLSMLETLAKFLEIPAHASQEAAIAYRIKRAGFPTDATLESYDWTRNPTTIAKEPFMELATGEFIRRKENAAFVGKSGLGKTHLMQGIARKCCTLGYRVRYETSASLIEALNGARAVKELPAKVRY